MKKAGSTWFYGFPSGPLMRSMSQTKLYLDVFFCFGYSTLVVLVSVSLVYACFLYIEFYL